MKKVFLLMAMLVVSGCSQHYYSGYKAYSSGPDYYYDSYGRRVYYDTSLRYRKNIVVPPNGHVYDHGPNHRYYNKGSQMYYDRGYRGRHYTRPRRRVDVRHHPHQAPGSRGIYHPHRAPGWDGTYNNRGQGSYYNYSDHRWRSR